MRKVKEWLRRYGPPEILLGPLVGTLVVDVFFFAPTILAYEARKKYLR